SKSVSRILQGITIVALIGFLDALYLFYGELQGNLGCLINGGVFNCKTVNFSQYAKIFNIPVSLLGALYYCAVTILVFLIIKYPRHVWLKLLLPTLALVGALFSIYLTVLELFVIKSLCEFCLLSAICSWIIAILVFYLKKKVYFSFF
ncbi:MAG: vitamin K epoxide reductase family protein, partial [Candidatus Heimdallarchaeaceae archaeon]